MHIKNLHILFVICLIMMVTACNTTKKQVKNTEAPKKSKEYEAYEVLSIFLEANKEKIIGNHANAKALFAECIRKDRTNHAAFYELASLLAMDKEYNDAILLAREALALHSNNEWYYILLAEIYHKTGNYQAAEKTTEKLVKKFSEKLEFRFELAKAYIYTDNIKKALNTYKYIEKQIGITEDVSMQMHNIYLYLKKPKQAIAELEKLIAAFPKNTSHLFELADLYLKLERHEQAIDIYRKIIQIEPDNAQIHFSLANYYRSIKDYDKSYDHVKKAFSNPNLESEAKIAVLLSYYELTEASKNTYLLEQAYELLDILIETHPNEAVGYSVYADFLNRDKRYKEARDMFVKVLDYNKNKYIVWEQLLKIELELANYQNLDSLSDLAIELFPEQALLYLFNGYANFSIKNYDKASKAFKRGTIYSLNKELTLEFYIYLGESFNHLKNYPESNAAFNNALKMAPENIQVLNNYSYYLSLRGENLEKAKDMAQKVNTLKPNNASYQDTYAWVLYKLGDYENAYVWLEKAIKNNGSKNGVILEHLGDVLYKLNKPDEALEYWQKAKETGRGSDKLEDKITTKTLIE